MLLLEALLIFGGFYLVLGLGIYIQAIVTTYDVLGTWNFSITKETIGVCKYPYWTLFWLEKIVSAFSK